MCVMYVCPCMAVGGTAARVFRMSQAVLTRTYVIEHVLTLAIRLPSARGDTNRISVDKV